MTFPRTANGQLDKSIIKYIHIILKKDFDFEFPEVAIACSENLHYIEPISKELLEQIISSGISYDEKTRQ